MIEVAKELVPDILSPDSNRSSLSATAPARADQKSSRMPREDWGKPGALVSSLSSKEQTSVKGEGETQRSVLERDKRSGTREALKSGCSDACARKSG